MTEAEAPVGDVLFPPSNTTKKSVLWDYEKRQISLCSFFTNTLRNVTLTQGRHVQDQVLTGHRLDSHYYGLFGFMAVNEEDIRNHIKKLRVMCECRKH